MEYFKILNLDREPFSNSPEPDFFYQSPQHIRCLQKIELAVRLRRGLNVVMGHVGTGKTTLCRHLIAQFADVETTETAVETHLLMDPSFSSPREFLAAVTMGFGILEKSPGPKAHDPEWTDWQLKEKIKDYLFQRGVDEGAIIVLIIDEGQKLPDFCLEILREFLNYETNEYKLLQIIIFGQPEFQQSLKRLANVADRVNLLYVLEPLNFQETRNMIRYRLARAALPESPPALFTFGGLLAIYRATGGYPRKIITLCHQVLLAVIIQNRSKAGWLLVRSCAARLASAEKERPFRSLRWTTGVLLLLTAVLVFFSVHPLTINSTKTPAPPRHEVPQAIGEGKKITSVAAVEPAPVRYERPELIGKLSLKDGRTIWWLLTDFYGVYNQSIIRSVSQANPHIKNMNLVKAGEVIHLPALPAEKTPLPANRYWVWIKTSKHLEETYEFYRIHKPAFPMLLFLPTWHPRHGMVFNILLRDGLPDEASARTTIASLPHALASGASVLKEVEKGTVFYTR
jgi:general secretion pathway protein A